MKILIADDHWIVRESLKQVIRRLQGTHAIFEAATFDEAMRVLDEHVMDLVLVDLIMPGFNEFEGLKRLRQRFAQALIAVISVHEDPAYVLRAIENGVIGYIPKSSSGPEVERALERVLGGEAYFPRRLLERQAQAEPSLAVPQVAPPDQAAATLTRREQEIVELMGMGFSVQRIADKLKLTDHTVRIHVGNLMKKLGLPDRSAAIHYAVNLATARKQRKAAT